MSLQTNKGAAAPDPASCRLGSLRGIPSDSPLQPSRAARGDSPDPCYAPRGAWGSFPRPLFVVRPGRPGRMRPGPRQRPSAGRPRGSLGLPRSCPLAPPPSAPPGAGSATLARCHKTGPTRPAVYNWRFTQRGALECLCFQSICTKTQVANATHFAQMHLQTKASTILSNQGFAIFSQKIDLREGCAPLGTTATMS